MARGWIRDCLRALAISAVMGALPAVAQAPTAPNTTAPGTAAPGAPKGDQVRIVYGEPKNPEHRAIHDRLRKRRVLEDLQEFLSPLRLPQQFTIKIEVLRRGQCVLQRRRGHDLL